LFHLTEDEGGFGLRGEADILGIRFPHQRERLSTGVIQENDAAFVLPREKYLIDCIYAEVKEGRVTFNSRSIGGDGGRENIARALEMFGVFESDDTQGPSKRLQERAEDVHRLITARRWGDFPGFIDEGRGVAVRFVVFASEGAELSDVRRHVSLEHVLSVVQRRMAPGDHCSAYRTSEDVQWKGLGGKIVEAIDLGYRRGRLHVDLKEFVAHVSQLCFRASY
jgi:hypothetical protein